MTSRHPTQEKSSNPPLIVCELRVLQLHSGARVIINAFLIIMWSKKDVYDNICRVVYIFIYACYYKRKILGPTSNAFVKTVRLVVL